MRGRKIDKHIHATAVSWALGKCTCIEQRETTESTTLSDVHVGSGYQSNAVLEQAGLLVNSFIHDEIKRNTIPADDPLKLDIDVYLSSVNPDLLKFLHCSTLYIS